MSVGGKQKHRLLEIAGVGWTRQERSPPSFRSSFRAGVEERAGGPAGTGVPTTFSSGSELVTPLPSWPPEEPSPLLPQGLWTRSFLRPQRPSSAFMLSPGPYLPILIPRLVGDTAEFSLFILYEISH